MMKQQDPPPLPERSPEPAAERQAAQLRRDGALRRITQVRAGVVAAAVGLSIGFAALVAGTAPGKTYHATSARRGAEVTPKATGQTGLSPGRAPRPATVSPQALGSPVASGGS